jgi:hypothetical protein
LATNYKIIFHIIVSVVLSGNFDDSDGNVNQSKSDDGYEKCQLSEKHNNK